MALKIPRKTPRYKLPIKSAPWTIYIVNQQLMDKLHPELASQRLCGLSDPNTHSIFLLSEYPLSVVTQTLIHEMGHAWMSDLDASKIPMKNGDQAVPEELAVEAVAIGVIEMFGHLNVMLDWVGKHVKDVEDEEESDE